MQKCKNKSHARNAASIETGDWVIIREGETAFVGYDQTEADAQIFTL